MLSPIPAGEQASFHLWKVLPQNLPDTGLLTARTDHPRWKLSAPAVLPLGADGHARVPWRPGHRAWGWDSRRSGQGPLGKKQSQAGELALTWASLGSSPDAPTGV